MKLKMETKQAKDLEPGDIVFCPTMVVLTAIRLFNTEIKGRFVHLYFVDNTVSVVPIDAEVVVADET